VLGLYSFVLSKELADDGTVVLKHVGVLYLLLNVFYEVHVLVDVLIVRISMV
jgi:hypothetical protein